MTRRPIACMIVARASRSMRVGSSARSSSRVVCQHLPVELERGEVVARASRRAAPRRARPPARRRSIASAGHPGEQRLVVVHDDAELARRSARSGGVAELAEPPRRASCEPRRARARGSRRPPLDARRRGGRACTERVRCGHVDVDVAVAPRSLSIVGRGSGSRRRCSSASSSRSGACLGRYPRYARARPTDARRLEMTELDRRTATSQRQADQPLDRRQALRRPVRAHGPGLQPGDRARRRAPSISPPSRRSTRPCRPRKRRSPPGGRSRSRKRAELFFAIRELFHEQPRGAREAPHAPSTARCSPTRSGR